MVIISGGMIGRDFDAVGSVVKIVGGTIGFGFDAQRGSVVNISDGRLGESFRVLGDSVVNISGGTVGDNFLSYTGSEVNLFGTQFVLDGLDITASFTPNVPFTITDRNVILSGLLVDGSPFVFDLNSTHGSGDYFDSSALLTITVIPEPSSLVLEFLAMAGMLTRYR